MKYLLDTDHISIIQSQSEPGYSAIVRNIRRHNPADFGISEAEVHERLADYYARFGHLLIKA